MAGERNPPLLHLVISNLITFACAWLVFAGTTNTNDVTALESAYKQIEVQGKQILELREEYLKARLEIIELQAAVKENVDKAQLLQNFLNYLPFPAWIKERGDDGLFRMVMINEKYTAEYGFTPSQYLGKTDFEAGHSESSAKEYAENDNFVWSYGRAQRTLETVQVNNIQLQVLVYKFPFPFPDGGEGVGGVSIKQ